MGWQDLSEELRCNQAKRRMELMNMLQTKRVRTDDVSKSSLGVVTDSTGAPAAAMGARGFKTSNESMSISGSKVALASRPVRQRVGQ